MKKILCILLVFLFVFVTPITVFANNTETYTEVAERITGIKPDKYKVNIYFFNSITCSHCKAEKEFLQVLQERYPNKLNIIDLEVTQNKINANYLGNILQIKQDKHNGIPYTIIGDRRFVGFSDSTKENIEKQIQYSLQNELANSNITLPVLGEVDMTTVSIPLVAVILGFIDGFNPCALWVLLFLINMLLNMQNKKRKWCLGITFLCVSGLVYLLSMLGINIAVNLIHIHSFKIVIATCIALFGVFNVFKFFKNIKKETGCSVVKNNKRKKITEKIKSITKEKNFILAMLGVIILASGVNLIELACSLGFPVVFSEILSINEISATMSFIYTLLYLLFYMLDDLFVFTVSMITLEVTGITNKYSKLCTLISGIIMTLMGILLIFKPEWLTFNF